MNLYFFLYAVAIALLLGLAALGAERALRLAERPARGVWLAALVGSWILPLLALFGVTSAEPPVAAEPVAWTAEEVVVVERAAEAAPVVERAWSELLASGMQVLERGVPWLSTMWTLSALVALALVALAMVRLAARSRRWPAATVFDESIRVSPDFGPALLGVLKPCIVLPRWVLGLGEGPLRLILAHEREHRSARDTLVLGAGSLAVLAAPWNLPLWWQFRRLRLAVELDCDQRVLRQGVSARDYGRLLVDVGDRVARVGMPAAALAEQSSFLERRLKMITERGTVDGGWRAAGALLLTGIMILAACETPAPAGLNNGAAPVAGDSAANRATVAIGEVDPAGVAIAGVEIREVGEEPLIYVDGVRVAAGLEDVVDASEIDRIEVIKGGAAEELYGVEAAGGVIQIFTYEATGNERGAGELTRRGDPEGSISLYSRRLEELSASYDTVTAVSEGPRRLTVRGLRRIEGPDTPLIYVDGVRIDGTDGASFLGTIRPQDIERIEVVKGAAATETHGADAVAGVIRIFTKAGGDGGTATFRFREQPVDTVEVTSTPGSGGANLRLRGAVTRFRAVEVADTILPSVDSVAARTDSVLATWIPSDSIRPIVAWADTIRSSNRR